MSELWELSVKRLGLQSLGGLTRTYGTYQVSIDGQPVPNLSGHICESIGPGDNTTVGHDRHLRIHEGRYPLSTQFGDRYRSVGYSDDANPPMPGFLLLETQQRSAILIHPGHPPKLYLSSIGCFNPTNPLSADQVMDFTESRARVIAMIDSLKNHDQNAFGQASNTPIANAWIVVVGEPMTPVADVPVA